MTQTNKNQLQTTTYCKVSAQDSVALMSLHQERRRQARKSGQADDAANDTLYNELESRYGGGFAQFVVDRLNAVTMHEKSL